MTFRCAKIAPRGASHIGRHMILLSAFLILLAGRSAASLTAQSGTNDMRVQIGLTAGGIGSFGASVEFLWGSRSIDVNVSTFTFNELSLAVTGKQYFGSADFRPFVGVGLWGIAGSTGEEGEDAGKALLLRVPIGGDWNFTGSHRLGGSLAVTSAMWIDRADPLDDRPAIRRPVPLPGFYYRFEP